MRPIRSLAIVLLLASVALTGCRTSKAEEPTTPTTRPPAATVTPTTRIPASATPTTAPPPPPSTTTPPVPRDPVCVGALSWGTGANQVVASPISAEIYQVRAATHQACDRVVFDLNGLGRPGYLVRYVPAVAADPSDRPIRVAGSAVLQVTIQAPDFAEWQAQTARVGRGQPEAVTDLRRPVDPRSKRDVSGLTVRCFRNDRRPDGQCPVHVAMLVSAAASRPDRCAAPPATSRPPVTSVATGMGLAAAPRT